MIANYKVIEYTSMIDINYWRIQHNSEFLDANQNRTPIEYAIDVATGKEAEETKNVKQSSIEAITEIIRLKKACNAECGTDYDIEREECFLEQLKSL